MTKDDLSELYKKPFSEAVEILEELMTQNGRAFLIGAGCSKCAGLPLTDELTDKTLESSVLTETTKNILKGLKNLFDGSIDANIEDYLSELVDLLAIAERRTMRGATNNKIDLGGISYSSIQLSDAVEQIKRAISDVIDCNIKISTHQKFIRAVHRPLRPGKTTFNQAVDYLVLNYDTLLEDALALERQPFSDGMDGGATGWWNHSTFNRDGLAARVFKLHGSINWCELTDDLLPRRIPKTLSVQADNSRRIMIWPASTKYRETQRDPYAQMTELARTILRPGIGSQRVLIICGYRFGDSHINLEIDSALRESAGRLTIIVFTSEEEPIGQLNIWHKDTNIREQVLIFSKRGFFHGDKCLRSSTDLPWWKFENLTRLLGGQ